MFEFESMDSTDMVKGKITDLKTTRLIQTAVVTIRETKRTERWTGGPVDFAEAIKRGYFEQIVKEIQAGTLNRTGLTDLNCRKLKAKVNESGHVSYHIQIIAPPPPKHLPKQVKRTHRPFRVIGYYDRNATLEQRLDDLEVVRQRVNTITWLAEVMGIDVTLYGWGGMLWAQLDKEGRDWRPRV